MKTSIFFLAFLVITFLYTSCDSPVPPPPLPIQIKKEISPLLCFNNFKQLKEVNDLVKIHPLEIKPKFISKHKNCVNQPSCILSFEYSIVGKYNIAHIVPDISLNLSPAPVRDSLVIQDRTYCLNDLSRSGQPIISHAFEIKLSKKVYVLLLIEDHNEQGNKKYVFCKGILVPLNSKSAPIFLGDSSQQEVLPKVYPDYLADFNKDGDLDFVLWAFGDTAQVYTIQNAVVKQLTDKIITVEKVKENYDNLCDRSYSISLDKSKWFFDLKNIPIPDCDACPFDPIKDLPSQYIYSAFGTGEIK